VFAAQDGTINRLCDSCQRSWIVETKEGARQAEALNKLDTKLVLPN
jgi:transposase-like protein